MTLLMYNFSTAVAAAVGLLPLGGENFPTMGGERNVRVRDLEKVIFQCLSLMLFDRFKNIWYSKTI